MRKISVPEAGMSTLFGAYDDNLRQLETLLNVRIRTQGQDLMVEGDAVNTAKVVRLIDQLGGLIAEGHPISDRDVKTASQLVAEDSAVDLRDHFLKDGQLRQAGKRRIAAKSANQRRYLDAIERQDIVFGIGPAGTGKTYLAMAQAVTYLLAKKVSRIVLVRPAVEAGEKLGFLPGDLQEKVNPYLRPLYDALYDMLDVEKADRFLELHLNLLGSDSRSYCSTTSISRLKDLLLSAHHSRHYALSASGTECVVHQDARAQILGQHQQSINALARRKSVWCCVSSARQIPAFQCSRNAQVVVLQTRVAHL